MGPVRSLNVILLLLGALSVLMLGGVPDPALAGDAAPPCHEAIQNAQTHGNAPSPSGKPGKATPAMSCCVSCVVAPAPQPAAPHPAMHSEAPASPVRASLPVGLSPAPEHGPPKA